MELGIRGKVAVVIGGSRGMGAAVAKGLSREGANVAVNYVADSKAANEVVEYITSCGSKGMAIQADVSKYENVNALFESVTAELGPVDILVHAAGIWPRAQVVEMSPHDWQRTLEVNLNAVFYTNQWVVSHLLARNAPGKIVNFSSQAAFRGGCHCIDNPARCVKAVDKLWGRRWQSWLLHGVSFGKLSCLVHTIVANQIRPTLSRRA